MRENNSCKYTSVVPTRDEGAGDFSGDLNKLW